MKRLFTLILFATLLCSTALAESDNNYYWFYDRVEVATTGKGLIYLSDDSECNEDDYATDSEIKHQEYGYNYYSFFYHAQPAAGYEFVGIFPTATPTSIEERISSSNNLDDMLSVTTMQATTSDNLEGYGFEPDVTYYAIFSKVYVKVDDNVKRAGKVDIDKVVNDKGDKVTITATSAGEGYQFDYWEDSYGNKIAENPYTFTVGDDPVIYTAHFKGDKILTIDFGDGKYIPFSSIYEADFESGINTYIINEIYKQFYDDNDRLITFSETDNAWGYVDDNYEFIKYEGEIPEFTTNYQIYETVQKYVPNTGFVLYGEGVKTIVLYNETPEDQFVAIETYLVGTATGAVQIESLPKKDANDNNLIYYVFDNGAFTKATSGTVEANSCYLVLTEGVQYPLPDKIYMNSDAPTSISTTTSDKQVKFIGVYNINGQKIEMPVKGVNIINGKKVIIK